MKVTLQVNGRELTFTEVENITISEESSKSKVAGKVRGPEEGKWFEVNPQAINQQLFKRKRGDLYQDKTRQIIVEAFEEMKKNPRYAKPFKTMVPKKTWESMTEKELMSLASSLGDHNTDWVEQAFEWAQRIANGETWRAVCNDADTANWYRLVVWKDGFCRLVGGSAKMNNHSSATDILGKVYSVNVRYHAVPSVVSYN